METKPQTKLIGLDEYRSTRFTPDSRPQRRTVQRWIDQEEILGKRIGKKYYIEVDATTGAELDPLEVQLMTH